MIDRENYSLIDSELSSLGASLWSLLRGGPQVDLMWDSLLSSMRDSLVFSLRNTIYREIYDQR